MPTTFDKYKTFYSFKKKNETIPIVFIHGVGLTKKIWDPQINFFKNQNILTYDLIGHGNTPLEKTQLNFEDFIKQLLNLIDELELKKIHLVGFSLGSLIARHFAAEHSDRLSSLVLHGSIYKRSVEQKRVIENRFELIKNSRSASKKSSLRRWLSEKFIKNNKEIYDKIYAMLENIDHKNLLKAYKLFVFYEDDDDMINKIKANTLVTTGQFDVGSTIEMAQNLSNQIKNSKYIEIKNGKHLCNIECAKDFNKTIELFIDQNYDEA
jgi:pimeloyl-ACP methyl ester carboxylesterase